MRKMGKTKFIVYVGIFSAIAFILQFIGSLMGLKVAGFLEIEFSDLPPLILTFYFGPLAGVLTELVKNLLHLFVTSTGGVGELANFVMNGTMCFVAGIIYKHIRTFKGAIFSLSFGTVAMAFAGILANLYIMLPLYMPTADFLQKFQLVTYTILPFNIVKGIVTSILTLLLYKRISKAIK